MQGVEVMNIQDDWEMKLSSASLTKLRDSEAKLLQDSETKVLE